MRDILDLAYDVDETLAWLRQAEETAVNLCSEDDGSPCGWKEMEAVCERLAEARALLDGVLAPIAEALEQAQADQDDMEDRWDAQRL